ncbi:methyltransferase [Actinomyces sp. oral taxon 414]|nr:methyltransferase [Actinomyces sp. oral taxon 414]
MGRLTLRSMNLWHTPLHRWGLAAAGIGADSRVLDVGCGGGGAVRRILRLTRAEVGAIDHSPAAVELTRRLNAAAAASGRLRVIEGSVEALPFRTGYFNVVTAFETVYFWPDLEAGLRETARVLGPGGRLVIVNEVADRQAAGIWADRLGMNVPDGDTLAETCVKAGFARVDVRRHPRVGAWLRVVAGI